MQRCYYISTDTVDPCYNLALEEVLLSSVPSGAVILYLWQNEHTVVIGCNQNPWAECRTGLLFEEGGHLVRRLSGGGAVYHDLGNLNFTFLCSEEDYDLKKQLSVIQSACKLAGIQAEFSGRNDLLADGRKFSGNAFYHKKGRAYHHGTLLVNTDMQRLQRYLNPPKAKLEAKGISSVRSRVVNLAELCPGLTCDAMRKHMLQAFGAVYGCAPTAWELTDQDVQRIEALTHNYADPERLFGKRLPFSCTLEGSFPWGHLELLLQVEKGVITDVQAFTDAMDTDLPQKLNHALRGCSFMADAMELALAPLEIADTLCPFIRQQL
ncbi:MAG: lipoate--protein ligase [Oscillospiraceae bacterium]|nr:lipoate--protein ligase [Oscillospiraceae bacterium]